MQIQLHSLLAVAAVLAAHPATGASDRADGKKPVVTSGPILVDWTPGSEWRKKLDREGQKVEPQAKVAPPAFGRDKMKVLATGTKRSIRRPWLPKAPTPSQPPGTPGK